MKGDGIVWIEVYVTTKYNGKVRRDSVLRGKPVGEHFQLQVSRAHSTKIKKGKVTLIPSKELSLMLYVKVSNQKARKNTLLED